MIVNYIGSRNFEPSDWEGVIGEIPVSQLGSTIGTHAGPGTIVVAYFMRRAKA